MEGKITGKTKHGEIDIDELAAIQPCMSRVMWQYTERYSIMYQLKKIREIAAVGAKTRPKWKSELEDFDKNYLVPIENAMKVKDWKTFEKAYNTSTQACNEVHKRIGYAYIKYKLPNPPDWLDLSP